MSLGGNLSSWCCPARWCCSGRCSSARRCRTSCTWSGSGASGPTFGLLSGTIEPIVAVIAAWLWIDQGLTALQVLGCAIVFAP